MAIAALKRGGKLGEKGPEGPEDEAREEEREAGPNESPGRKRGGEMPKRQKRKAGGAVHGAAPKSRPDRKRANGGGTADLHPETAAGRMSSMPYERVGAKPDGGGRGLDKD